jgi:hypothetical protein
MTFKNTRASEAHSEIHPKERRSMSRTIPYWNNGLLTIVQTILVLAILPSTFLVVPYLYRVISNSWSWSLIRSDSVTGLWVGTLRVPTPTAKASGPTDALGQQILADQLSHYPPAQAAHRSSGDIAIMIKPHLQIFTWLSHVAGTAVTCDASGRHTNLQFSMGDFHDNKLNLFLKNMKSFTDGGGDLDGSLSGDVLTLTYRTGDGTLVGTMSKGNSQTFENTCSSLVQSQKN